MAGTIPLSLTQQFDSEAKPLIGGKLYIIEAGTTSTPQDSYQDEALTILHPNPITLDSAGRIPQFFLADGLIKIRLTDADGVDQLTADTILVIGPSGGGGGGGGGAVDPTTILTTGDFKLSYQTGALTGFVRANGRSIGSSTSGATERANADTSALYVFLWNADPNLSVATGRGANAAADFAANKALSLPDCRARNLAGLADMGGSTSTLFNGVTFNSPYTSTSLGATGGSAYTTITTPNLPPYTPAGSVAPPIVNSLSGAQAISAANGSIAASLSGSGTNVYPTSQMGVVTSGAFTGTAQGGTSTPAATLSPVILLTVYLKL